jgi:hypothetical protein
MVRRTLPISLQAARENLIAIPTSDPQTHFAGGKRRRIPSVEGGRE